MKSNKVNHFTSVIPLNLFIEIMSDLYKEILEFNKMSFNREKLIEDYAQQMLDSMDMKTMECFVYDTLVANLNEYNDEELITEVTDYYPELLEDVETL